MLTKDDLPCIDCITLSICKAIQTKYKEKHMQGIFITTLESRCKLLAKYTESRYSQLHDTVIDVLNFFYKE